MYDFFITEDKEETLLIDCEGGARAKSLAALLGMYKLHAEIDIHVTEDITLYAVIVNDSHGYKDPRAPEMGRRSYGKPDMPEKDFTHWDRLRLSLSIPDGSRDMTPNKSTLLECGIDKLNGLSYEKGCYIGQELTARMHYRGLTKKNLRIISAHDLGLEQLPPFWRGDKKR